jgi:hypothetical protein
MNRQIKFRVWDKKNSQFLQNDNNGVDKTIFDLWDWAEAMSTCLLFPMDDYVFQEYSGLTDKNNKPIYEGDFIRGMFDHGPAGLREEILPVKWSNEDGYQWNYWDLSTIEVVGNLNEWPCHKPNSFDHNSECLTCDGWPSDCPFLKFSPSPKLILKQ